MDFLIQYGVFLAKIVTLVIALLLTLAGIFALASKGKDKSKGKLTVEKLNERFEEIAHHMKSVTHGKAETKKDKKAAKAQKKSNKSDTRKRLFVLRFDGDIKASAVSNLREEVTAVLLAAKPKDEVLLCIDSPGGMVNTYGLAASQIQRLKAANVNITVSIDTVAASGGYLMACTADHIIAAPFAIVGSIGVVSQLPNFHRFLEKHNVDFEQITAGEYKRTLTMFGKNTDKGRDKMQEDVDDIHALFKNFIRQHRPQVDLDKTATGEYWFGARAIELNLVDALKTSDDFLLQAKDHHDIFEVKYHIKKPLTQKISIGFSTLLNRLARSESHYA